MIRPKCTLSMGFIKKNCALKVCMQGDKKIMAPLSCIYDLFLIISCKSDEKISYSLLVRFRQFICHISNSWIWKFFISFAWKSQKLGQVLLTRGPLFFCHPVRGSQEVSRQKITVIIVGYHFSSQLTATLNICLICFEIAWTLAILLEHMHMKFEYPLSIHKDKNWYIQLLEIE